MCISILSIFSGLECIKGKVHYKRQIKRDCTSHKILTYHSMITTILIIVGLVRPCKNSLGSKDICADKVQ